MNRLITLDLQDWKRLVFGNGSGGREKPVGKPFEEPYFLFDLEKDPFEEENPIGRYPNVAEPMTESLKILMNSGEEQIYLTYRLFICIYYK